MSTRNSVRKWKRLYEQFGEAGLVPLGAGRPTETVTEALCRELLELIESKPKDSGYLSSRWTSQMLAEQLWERCKEGIHASTVRRLLPKLGVVWRRARPTLCIKDPKKAQKMKEIDKALKQASAENPVFYVDEVDIDLNPRIGHAWTKRAKQMAVPTPGKNEKRYLAGALNATTGKVIWVEWEKKNAEIFILLLAKLRKCYRQAKRITLIADNYVIHKSAMTQCFLEHNRKFRILFQPAYHPWVNRIERLWKKLHDVVTRNHRYPTMAKLMEAVRTFMNNASPFPASEPQLMRLEGG
jgi:transposase